MSFDPKTYAQRDIPATSDDQARPADATNRGPLTVQALLDHPERRAELYLDGRSHQDAVNAEATAEDEYYAAFDEEIERHPICSPRLILERQGRNGS